MSDRAPLVSVCIPVYNGARYLAAAIESVLAQTFADWELVITDDASTDDSLTVARRFDDPRIRVLPSERNAGAAGNWNRAVGASRGALVKVLCQDDLIEPDCLAKQVKPMLEDETIAVVSGRRDVIDPDGNVIFRGKPKLGTGRVAGAAALRAVVRSGTNPIGEPAAVLFRRDGFDRAGGFNGKRLYMIDLDLWCRLLSFGDLFVVSETIASFRVSGKSLSASIGKQQASQAKAFFRELGDERPDAVTRRDVKIGCAKASVLGVLRGAVFNVATRRARRNST